MKIIDILNKMSNGDLKNGFKIGWNGFTYTYNEINGFRDKHGDTLSENTFIECCLNDEVEVIEEEEIEESKKCLNEIIQNIYAEGKAIKLDNLRKYIQELEQKESILDKVTDKLKEDIKEFDKLRKLHKMYSPSEERLSSKYFYALKLLNIVGGEKK